MTLQELAGITASVIVSLGGGGAIVFGLSGYLGRVWADRALEKQRQENTQLNLQLTSQLGLITEERRHLLQLRQLEHQVRFSKLHEKRGEVLADVYKRLVKSQQVAKQYVFHKKDDGTAYKQAVESLREFRDFVELHRIYLPEKICRLLSDFAGSLWNPVTGVRIYADIDTTNSAAYIERRKEFREAFDAFAESGEIEEARRFIEDEFRQILEGALPSS